MAKRQYENKIALKTMNFVDINEPIKEESEKATVEEENAEEKVSKANSNAKILEEHTKDANKPVDNVKAEPSNNVSSRIVTESQANAPARVESNKRGRKPSENTMERDFISVNIGDGLREDLVYLCRRHEKQTGKKSVGLATYIRYLIEQDISKNQEFLDAARAFEKNFE